MSSHKTNEAIKHVLSAARIGTYEAATSCSSLDRALALYAWNAQVSAAMLAPLHICEVAIRNAVSEALTLEYGEMWPWNYAFETSLPSSGKFNMREHLIKNRTGMTYPVKVIPQIAFVFWEKMFTGRFDGQIWNAHLKRIMPHLNPTWSVQFARKKINNDLNKIRVLRNRIAHHEPIINRVLSDDFRLIQGLIYSRCPITAEWMIKNQKAQKLIFLKPT
jgi:hypothetical protein